MSITDEKYQGQFTVEERKAMTAQNLRDLRKIKKLSQKEVAGYLNIPATTYNTYESGRTEPPIEILVRLSFLYETPIDIIVSRDRTYRTATDIGKQMEEYRQQVAELDKQIAEGGENNQVILALRETMEKLADAMINYSNQPEVQKAVEASIDTKK